MSNEHTPGPWTAIVTTKACFHRGNRVSIVWGNLDCLCAPEEPDPDGVLLGIPCLCAAQTVAEVWPSDNDSDIADGKLIAAAPELNAYRKYIEDNLERIERGGWTPVCFDEFRESEECANYMKEEA